MRRAENSSLALVSADTLLHIRTNSTRLLEFFRQDPFVRHHIPDVEIEDDLPMDRDQGIDFFPPYELEFDETSEDPSAKFDPSLRCLSVSGMLDRDYEEIMFVFNALQLFSRMYQEKEIFAVHSGGITFGAEAALILGGERAGKSTLTALLCSELGATYLCDERALASLINGRAHWIGGNKVLRLRSLADVRIDSECLRTVFRDVTGASVSDHKLCLEARLPHTDPIPVRHIFFVRLTSHESGIREHHRESAIYKLFATLSEDIHGLWCPILGTGYAMPSIDSVELCQSRLAMAQALADDRIGLWQCYGEAWDVSQMISETVLKDV
jgi:hypothetical protein